MKTLLSIQYANILEESNDRNILVAYSDGTSEILKVSTINSMAGEEGQRIIDYYTDQKSLFTSIKTQADLL